MKLIKSSDYAKQVECSVRTLYRRIDDGSLDIVKSKTGRIFVKQDLIKEQKIVIYSRVSSSENKSNLDSQAGRLLQYCNAKGYKVHDLIKEVGSGLNDNRSKLIKILKDHSITKIVVEHKDRLTRFNFNMFVTFFNALGVEVICTEETLSKSFENELVEDMLSLITVFSAKIYGRRGKKKIINEDKSS